MEGIIDRGIFRLSWEPAFFVVFIEIVGFQ